MALETETRGPFTRGEIPEDIVMFFKRPESKGGGPVNLTGYNAEIDVAKEGETTVTKSASISNAEEGEVRYTWEEGDLDGGSVTVQFWVYSGASPETTRLASKVVTLQVFEGPRHAVQS